MGLTQIEYGANIQLAQQNIEYKFEYRDLAEALYLALADDAFYITLEQHSAGREAMLRYLEQDLAPPS